jgi:arsenite oxidase small subunit
MNRREFVACGVAFATLSEQLAAASQAPVKAYDKARLTGPNGAALKASSLLADTNYVFQYPFASTPAFLLNLGRNIKGVGKQQSIVAFSAICAHKLAYPTKEVSFIRFQAQASEQGTAQSIHCCADHSVYDPAAQAKVLSGPAPAPLAVIVLQHDAKTDELFAVGTQGLEQFNPFFEKYDFKLALEYGNRAKQTMGNATEVSLLDKYCRNVRAC